MNTNNIIIFLLSDLSGGGAEKVIITIAESLSKQGLDVYLLVVSKHGAYSKTLPKNLKVIFLNMKYRKINKLISIPKILSLINKLKPHAVISTLNGANLLNIICSKLSFLKYKTIIREASSPMLAYKKKGLFQSPVIYVNKFLFKLCDVIICPSFGSSVDSEIYYSIPKYKSYVIPNPINFNNLSLKMNETPEFELNTNNYILSVGRLEYVKGFDILIKAFQILRNSYKINTQLIILGDGPKKKELEKITIDLGVHNFVSFLGFIKNPYPYYKSAKLYCLSSRWEGSPNSLLDAVALNIPSVSTDCMHGPSEILSSEFLAKVDDANDLADKMNNVYNNIHLREPSLALINTHNIDIVTQRWLQVIYGK